MKGDNACKWILMGKKKQCGRRCVGEYCSFHNTSLSKGGGMVPCVECGVGVKSKMALCEDCGGGYARVKRWRKRNFAIMTEFRRLSTIEISI